MPFILSARNVVSICIWTFLYCKGQDVFLKIFGDYTGLCSMVSQSQLGHMRGLKVYGVPIVGSLIKMEVLQNGNILLP